MASSSTPSTLLTTDAQTQQEDADSGYKHPFVDFACNVCGLKENCFYGKLVSGNGHFPHDVYYLRDPFEPPSKRGRKPMLFDFLVLGAVCHLCSRAVCIHKSCSIYFGNHFCVDCISRERRSFPDEVIQLVTKAQEGHIQFGAHSKTSSAT